MILVINTGSSSIKAKLFEIHKGKVMEIDDFSIANIPTRNIADFSIAVTSLVKNNKLAEKNITKVAYRVVHGGDEGKNGSIIDKNIEKLIEKYNHLSPNHNPYALAVIRQTKKYLKKLNIMFFLTPHTLKTFQVKINRILSPMFLIMV